MECNNIQYYIFIKWWKLAEGITNPKNYTIETASFTLNNPQKDGYTFTGWIGSNGTTPNTTVTISKGTTGDKEFIANWKANEYIVTFNPDEGTVIHLLKQ